MGLGHAKLAGGTRKKQATRHCSKIVAGPEVDDEAVGPRFF